MEADSSDETQDFTDFLLSDELDLNFLEFQENPAGVSLDSPVITSEDPEERITAAFISHRQSAWFASTMDVLLPENAFRTLPRGPAKSVQHVAVTEPERDIALLRCSEGWLAGPPSPASHGRKEPVSWFETVKREGYNPLMSISRSWLNEGSEPQDMKAHTQRPRSKGGGWMLASFRKWVASIGPYKGLILSIL